MKNDKYYNFNKEVWNKKSEIQKKHIILKEVEDICNFMGIPIPKVIFTEETGINGKANYTDNVLEISRYFLEKESSINYKKDCSYTLLATIYHEITHFVQYYESKGLTQDNPIKLGIDAVKKKIKYNGEDITISFYIVAKNIDLNKFLYNTYVLQPNEYEANLSGERILKQYFPETKSKEIYKIQEAKKFFKENFGIDNPVEQISNALQNIYNNNHNKECDGIFEEFIKICCVCSYYADEEDYGRNRVTLFLEPFLQNHNIKINEEDISYN